MRRTSFRDMNCSVAQCLEVVGEWWTMLIVRDLFMGVRRFDDFQERLGISRNVLTERLNKLVEQGIVERRPYQERPKRHEYVLTEKGIGLWPVLNAMRQWGDEWEAPNGPRIDIVHRSCDHVTTGVIVCEHCRAEMGARDVRAVPGPGADETSPSPVRAART